jgi:type II secretory pathway pseudopilin PulG
MSLLLMSMLLTAIALAMRASMDSYEQNRNAAAVNQTARALATRMQREIRQAEAVDANTASNVKVVIIPPASPAGLQEITYSYNSSDQTFTYHLHYTDSSNDTTETPISSSSEIRVVITPPAGASGLQRIIYWYNSSNQTLTCSRHYTNVSMDASETLFGSSSEVELSGFHVTWNTVKNAQGLWCTQRMTCTTYFTIDGQTTPLVFTASPSRNQTY